MVNLAGSVVAISCVKEADTKNHEKYSVGSGFLVARDLVMTAYHVVKPAKEVVRLKFAGQNFEDAVATDNTTGIVWYSESLDLALVRCNDHSLPTLKLAEDFFDLNQRPYAIAHGFPFPCWDDNDCNNDGEPKTFEGQACDFCEANTSPSFSLANINLQAKSKGDKDIQQWKRASGSHVRTKEKEPQVIGVITHEDADWKDTLKCTPVWLAFKNEDFCDIYYGSSDQWLALERSERQETVQKAKHIALLDIALLKLSVKAWAAIATAFNNADNENILRKGHNLAEIRDCKRLIQSIAIVLNDKTFVRERAALEQVMCAYAPLLLDTDELKFVFYARKKPEAVSLRPVVRNLTEAEVVSAAIDGRSSSFERKAKQGDIAIGTDYIPLPPRSGIENNATAFTSATIDFLKNTTSIEDVLEGASEALKERLFSEDVQRKEIQELIKSNKEDGHSSYYIAIDLRDDIIANTEVKADIRAKLADLKSTFPELHLIPMSNENDRIRNEGLNKLRMSLPTAQNME